MLNPECELLHPRKRLHSTFNVQNNTSAILQNTYGNMGLFQFPYKN